MTESKNTTAAQEPTKVWNRKFVYLLFMSIFISFGNFMMRPVVSNYALSMGASLATAGLVAGIAFAVATLMRPISGFLSDRISKKVSLVAAAASFATAGFGCSLAGSVPVLAACCIIQGIAYAFQSIGSVALIALCVPQNRMGTAMGWSGVIQSVAMALGPSLTAAVAAQWGYSSCFLTGGILTAIACVMAIAFRAPAGAQGAAKKTANHKEGESGLVHLFKQAFYVPALPITMIALFCCCSHAAMSGLLLTLGEQGFVENAAAYFLAYAAFALVSRPFAGRLTDSLGPVKVGLPLLAIGVAGMAAITFGGGPLAIIFCGALMGIGQSSTLSITQAEAVRGVDPAFLGRATNTYYTGLDLGGALGPFVGGIFLGMGSPQGFFIFLMSTLVLGAILLIIFGRRKSRKRR